MTQKLNGLRILVVDDDRDFAEGLAEALELQGHHVAAVTSGDEGIQRYREGEFDIAFMDVRMPGRDGIESFLQIRKIKPDARVVMMTGYSVEQLLDRAVRNGAWGVLHKLLNMHQINAMLERIKPAGILIADDDPEFVSSLREILEQEGYVVHSANTGRAAVERVRAGGVDILILDLRMPILNGLEVYLELQRSGHVVPTIIVTAYADEEQRAIGRLSEFQVSGILTKPFNTQSLLQTIEVLSRKE